MAKKILILGNGFDLAHGLPTRYSDFLDFATRALAIYSFNGTSQRYLMHQLDTWDTKSDSAKNTLSEMLKDLFEKRSEEKNPTNDLLGTYTQQVHVNDRLDMFNEYLKDNIWYLYISKLYDDSQMRGENWIDFESEISYIIQMLDEKHTSLIQSFYELYNKLDHIHDNSMEKFNLFYLVYNNYTDNRPTIRQLRAQLYGDLEKMIWAFEIYLTDFVEKISPPLGSIDEIEKLNPDYVISFNYTKTYEKIYKGQVCHIHGVCEVGRDKEKNNMVLGIDEYLPKSERSEKVDFSIFKKFVQRILKRNDVSYASWIKEINGGPTGTAYVLGDNVCTGSLVRQAPFSDIYIYGHSLDITDKDILRKFLISDHTRIHIYARDKASEGTLISNLIRLTDEDNVINKSTSNPPMLEFWRTV